MSVYGDAHHDDEHGHHGSEAPIIISAGLPLFFIGFITSGWLFIGIGLAITTIGLLIWMREDLGFDGSHEPMATLNPYNNIEIRKVGMWVFLMSEMMVFSSFFVTYVRYRTSIPNCTELFFQLVGSGSQLAGATYNCYEPASHLIAHNFWTLAPGAINTFALIISSYTLVLALVNANRGNTRKTTMWLSVTLALGTLFLILKLTEWYLGFGDNIPSLQYEGYMLDSMTSGSATAANYQWHGPLLNDVCSEKLIGAQADAHPFRAGIEDPVAQIAACKDAAHDFNMNIRISASIFFITTGTHGLHVFLGLLMLIYLIYKNVTGRFTPMNAQGIEYFALYWHFVDLVWVVVFPAFYLY